MLPLSLILLAIPTTNDTETETALLGGGCFWCTETIFSQIDGVINVESGYSGGDDPNPTYEDVCSGETGHAEVIKIEFDPKKISYSELLRVFFLTHDPTTPNQQGADIGTQYRSVIFYTTNNQKTTAEETIRTLTLEKIYSAPIVTEIVPFKNYYRAEQYHQDYFSRNRFQPYCRFVIEPKISKFKHTFPLILKK